MLRSLIPALALMTMTAAHADHLPVPVDAPPAFKSECGACHLAFPPALLAAADWQRVIAKLDAHYGDNATLDEPSRRSIEAFLVRNAGNGRRTVGAATSDAVLPRLTLSRWFVHEHDEVPASVWKDKRVGSAANCAACHTQAAAGSFREREIRLPGGYRHGHD